MNGNLWAGYGRFTRDPELRAVGASQTPVCRFSLAVNRPYRKDAESKTDFIDFTAWNKTAEFISKYFNKGKRIAIVGRVEVNSWEDKDGVKRKYFQVVVDEAAFLDSKPEPEAEANWRAGEFTEAAPEAEEEEDDLPF